MSHGLSTSPVHPSASARPPPGQHLPLFHMESLPGGVPGECPPVWALDMHPKYPGFYLRQPQTTRVSQISHLRPYKGKCPDAAEPIWIRFQTRASALRCVIKALFQRGAPAGGIRTPGQRGPSARHTNERRSGQLGVVWDLGEQPALPPVLRGRGRRPRRAAGCAARSPASEGGQEAGSSGSVTLPLSTAGKGSACSGSRGPEGPVGSSE